MSDDHLRPLRLPPGGQLTRLFLVRHGATAANEMRPYILQGCEMDNPLSATGERQAADLARLLGDFEFGGIYASPMIRAVQTATAVAERRSQAVTTLPELRECSVGRWEGLSWDQIQERDPDNHRRFFANPVTEPHPGGESYGDVLCRVRPALATLFDQHAGQNILVVAHNMVNRVYLAELAGIELKHARRLKQSNACVNLLEIRQGELNLISLNSVLHLSDV